MFFSAFLTEAGPLRFFPSMKDFCRRAQENPLDFATTRSVATEPGLIGGASVVVLNFLV
jgi:hypothetical protein